MKKTYRKHIGLACVAALGLSLSACGGGGSTASKSPTGTSIIQLAGVVVDGYMGGATAFVDRNNNGVLNSNEPFAITASNGFYAISTNNINWKTGDETFPIVVKIPATAIDSDTGMAVGKEFVLSAPAGSLNQKVVVSPLTTMVKTVMDSTGVDIYTAAEDIKKKLNLPNIDVFADFNTATNQKNADYVKVKKVAQVVAQSVKAQFNDVYTAVNKYNTNNPTATQASISDVIGIITNQVLNQLTNINTAITSNVGIWDPYAVAVANVVPVDVYSTSLNNAIATQSQLTLAAANKAQAKADAANATAQTALALAQTLLQQAQALQDTYAQLMMNDSYAVAVASSQAVTANPYASTTLINNAVSYVANSAKPTIILKGGSNITVALGSTFTDFYTAYDVNGNNLNARVQIIGTVNTAKVGSYILNYSVVATGATATAKRTVTVVGDITAPVIHLFGSNPVNINIGANYVDNGVYVTDNIDPYAKLVTTITVPNPATAGTYKVTYTATDASNNSATLTRTVNVKDTVAPVITLNGAATMNLIIGKPFTNPVATVTDNLDKGLLATVVGAVNTAALGTYSLTYNATDKAGNKAQPVTLTVTVIAKPVGVTLTIYDESIWYNVWSSGGKFPTAAQQQTAISKGVIAGAKIVVDNAGAAKTYTTDAKGQVIIPAIDVGLHEIAIFADGYIWQAISQVTFNPAKKNQFSLTPSSNINANNGRNSHLVLAVNLPTAQPANTMVELSIADAYGNVYTASTWQQYNNATATNFLGADFQNIQSAPGSTISGVMTAREITCDVYGMNCTETNAGNLGQVSFVTQSWNGQRLPTGTVNVTYAATHITKPVGVNTGHPVIGLNITNSYAAPGTLVPSGQQTPTIQLAYTYTDIYGNPHSNNTWVNVQTVGTFDAYGTYLGQKVAAGAVSASLWGITDSYGNTLPVGTIITARITATDMNYNAATNNWVATNAVDLGLQTITIQASPYPGFPAQSLPASQLKTQLSIVFPAIAPTPITVLTVQSLVPPTGIIMNQGMGVDNWQAALQAGSTVPFYSDYVQSTFVNGVQQALKLPHTFTRYQALTGDLNFYVSGSDAYSNAQWNYDTTIPVGSIVSYASQITTPLIVSPYQTGNVIKVTPVNGGALRTGNMGLMMYDTYTGTQIWNILVPSNVNSITLPTVPPGIVNHLVKGNPYLLDVDTTIYTGAGSPQNMTQFLYSIGTNPFNNGGVNSSRENYIIPKIPYKY